MTNEVFNLGTKIDPNEFGHPKFWKIKAKFLPKRTNDLRSEILKYVGQIAVWTFAGTGGTNESYPGQWRWMAPTEWNGLWAPDEDLEFISDE